jgi:hypothetical protein
MNEKVRLLENRVTSSVSLRVEYYSETIGAVEVSRFTDEKTAHEYYDETMVEGKHPKIFRETTTVVLEELKYEQG